MPLKLTEEDWKACKIITSSAGGQRLATGVRWDLIPFESLEEVSKILAYGADKYSPNNWHNLDFDSEQSPINHGIRHFSKAKTYPPGSPERIRQLAKAATNALFQLWHEVNLKRNGNEGPV